ncbi:MAG: hypothetical protein ACO1OT_07495 [Heyndrickxia sp.]
MRKYYSFLSLLLSIVLILVMKIRDQWEPAVILIALLFSIIGFVTSFFMHKGIVRWIALIGNAVIFLLIVVFSMLIIIALKNFS